MGTRTVVVILDAWTQGHLDRWLAKDVRDEEQQATRDAIMRALAENPRLIDECSWPEMAERGKR